MNKLQMLRNIIRVISKCTWIKHTFSAKVLRVPCTITRINRPTPFAVATTARFRPRVAG